MKNKCKKKRDNQEKKTTQTLPPFLRPNTNTKSKLLLLRLPLLPLHPPPPLQMVFNHSPHRHARVTTYHSPANARANSYSTLHPPTRLLSREALGDRSLRKAFLGVHRRSEKGERTPHSSNYLALQSFCFSDMTTGNLYPGGFFLLNSKI